MNKLRLFSKTFVPWPTKMQMFEFCAWQPEKTAAFRDAITGFHAKWPMKQISHAARPIRSTTHNSSVWNSRARFSDVGKCRLFSQATHVIPVLRVTAILLPSTMDQKLWLTRSRPGAGSRKSQTSGFLCSLWHVKQRYENVKLLRLRNILLPARAIRAADQKDCNYGDGIALLLYTDLPQWQGWLVYPQHWELASNLHFARFSFASFQAFQLLSPQQDCTSWLR